MNSSIILIFLALASASDLKFLQKFYNQCSTKAEIFKCLKIQSLKIMDKALRSKSINLTSGVSLVTDREGRDLSKPLNGTKLEKLSSDEVDEMLEGTTARFLKSHKLEISVPRLIEEGRRRRKKGGGAWGALLVALGIKGTFLTMAYQGIAVMSGTAIIVGKMALILSAILGLKKLVSSNQEKTTVEIVKVPQHSEAHTHSTSYEDHDDHYHRSSSGFGRRIGYKTV